MQILCRNDAGNTTKVENLLELTYRTYYINSSHCKNKAAKCDKVTANISSHKFVSLVSLMDKLILFIIIM